MSEKGNPNTDIPPTNPDVIDDRHISKLHKI